MDESQEAQFACLEFSGPDAAAFLQGYLTADLDQLDAHRGLPMAFCNIKGRVAASGWAFGEPTRVRLLVHASVADDLGRELGKYLLFAKSKLAAGGRLRFSPLAEKPATCVELPGLGYTVTPDADVGSLQRGSARGHPSQVKSPARPARLQSRFP